MKPTIVVDIGNSRVKWGLCAEDRVVHHSSLPPDDPAFWEEQIKRWEVVAKSHWAVASVHPLTANRFMEWLKLRGDPFTIIQERGRLPIEIKVSESHRVGIDRLLNAVAAKNRVQRPVSIFIIDAGSAVTVDWLDEEGAFQGGAIFPGIQLMAKALHDYTAALPLVEIKTIPPPLMFPRLPGGNTVSAIAGGISWAAAGGVKACIRQMLCGVPGPRHRYVTFLTGGDAEFLVNVLDSEVQLWPEMTLEGIRLAAEALP
jgi:type III pantothenate kinase